MSSVDREAFNRVLSKLLLEGENIDQAEYEATREQLWQAAQPSAPAAWTEEGLARDIAWTLRNGEMAFGAGFNGPMVDTIAAIAASVALSRPAASGGEVVVATGILVYDPPFVYVKQDQEGRDPLVFSGWAVIDADWNIPDGHRVQIIARKVEGE